MMNRLGRMALAGVLLLSFFPTLAEVVPPFREVMVVEKGRVMPMDSLARIVLRKLSGRQALSDRSAAEWLADLLFKPESSGQAPLFLVDHPDVLNALGLAGDKRVRLSFHQLEPVLPRLSELARSASFMEPEQRSAVENGLLQLYENVYLFVTLRDAFIWAFPHRDFLVTQPENTKLLDLPVQSAPFAFIDLYPRIARMEKVLANGEGEGGAQPSAARVEVRSLLDQIRSWDNDLKKGTLHLLPNEGSDQAWSPVALAFDAHHPFYPASLLWREAIDAYRQQRMAVFANKIEAFNQQIAQHPVAGGFAGKVGHEVFYNRLDPFFWSRIGYGLALVLLLLSFLFWRRALLQLALISVLTGLTLHSVGMVLRFLITHRSPVTNLYETFVFVAWAAVLLGLSLGLRKHQAFCLTTASASGLAFLMVAARFTSGDTMGQLVAVLNSNWWLSVHVITISAGYAGCVVAGVIGHVYLVQTLLKKENHEVMAHTQRTLYATLVFGLFFTFVGTVMGGIWADQSWGRFWGWDPKENGALVIILWVAIILHARIARMIGSFGFAAGAIGSIIMVVLAWFGVNLLGVGMHSYGFTSGIAKGLAMFVVAELLFILFAAYKRVKGPAA